MLKVKTQSWAKPYENTDEDTGTMRKSRGQSVRRRKGDTTDITADTKIEIESIVGDQEKESIIEADEIGPGPGQLVARRGLEREKRIERLQESTLSATVVAHLVEGMKTEAIDIDGMIMTNEGSHPA